MAQSQKRRNSMDFWADFDVFISVFEKSRAKMEDSVNELRTLCFNMGLEDGFIVQFSGRVVCEGLVYGAIAALAFGFTLLLFDLYELVTLTATAAAVWVGKICFERVRRLVKLRKVKKLLLELLETLRALQDHMDTVETSLKKQNRDLGVLVQTRAEIQTLSSLLLQSRMEWSDWWQLDEASQQSERAVMWMKQLWEDLVFMKESNTGNI